MSSSLPPPSIQATASLPDIRYRPVIHYSPRQGFMNDPNGLIRMDDGTYHLFYQYNPARAHSGNVHWGHATSPDLLTWTEREPAIYPDARGDAFSGSAIWDKDDTSGLFGRRPGGMVAVFTRSSPGRQTQDLAYQDGQDARLLMYAGNPVLDIESNSFRDPKVFWHEASRRWIMVVVQARRHEVQFYASPDLKQWTPTGTFAHAGLQGLDYECPDLVELPVEGGGTRWVLFLSINPGAPTGGSTVQFFVGNFDGQTFVPEDHATRFMDAGQDFYALQTFANTPGRVIGIAWLNNWLYCNDIPAYPARGAMTLPRELSLRRQADHWYVVQRLPDLSSRHQGAGLRETRDRATGLIASFPWSASHALDITATGKLTHGGRLLVRLTNSHGECLEAGLDNNTYPGYFMDRSGLRGFTHPFWNHKAIQSLLDGLDVFDFRLVIDQCTIELVAMDGQVAATQLHFFAHPPERLDVMVSQGEWYEGNLRIDRIGAIG